MRVDPIVSRVAERYARRTIRFDTRAVQLVGYALAERAIKKLVQTLPAGSGLEWELGRNEVIERDRIDMHDVRGLAKAIEILVKHRRLRNNTKPTAGGHFAVGDDEITLYLDSEWTPEALQKVQSDVEGTFASFLVHEVTHALDVAPAGDIERADGDQTKYFNQPLEFRAYTKQIVTDIVPLWKSILRRNPKKSGASLIEAALETSRNYAKVKVHFDRRSHQRLRQILVRELQDAGLLLQSET